jgi:hypothetical protein
MNAGIPQGSPRFLWEVTVAGDWIKVRTDLHDDPAVLVLAADLDTDTDRVVGLLIRFWGWVDRQLRSGDAPVTLLCVDRVTGCDGLAKLLVKVGWLFETDDGIHVPNFERHFTQTAKKRALTQKRMRDFRLRSGDASVTHQSAPEKRRDDEEEEMRISAAKSPPMTAKNRRRSSPRMEWASWVSWWNALADKEGLPGIRDSLTDSRKRKLKARMTEHGDFRAELATHIERRDRWHREHRLPKFDHILSAEKLSRWLEGQYDAECDANVPVDAAKHSAIERLQKLDGATWRGHTITSIGLQDPWGV